MHAQDDRRAIGDRGGVVGDAGPVGGADLAQDRAGLGHDVRDTKTAADLHQLTARDDDFTAGGQRRQREERRRGVVVHDHRGLGAGQAAEESLGVRVPPSPGSCGEVVFEVGVAGCELGDARRGHPGERRPAEVGVNDDAGGVDDGDERRCVRRGQASLDLALQDRRDLVGAFSRALVRARRCQPFAHRRRLGAQRVDDSRPPVPAFEETHRRTLAQLLD